MEIERKWLIAHCPVDLTNCPYYKIQQGYLCTNPVVRIRRQDEDYILTYKSGGKMVREEYNLPLTKEAFDHLVKKIDGILISKTRYLIALDNNLKVELDYFDSPYEHLCLAEIEFPTVEEATSFTVLDWFGEDVTFSSEYHNSALSKGLAKV